jgi:hypothetical protein
MSTLHRGNDGILEGTNHVNIVISVRAVQRKCHYQNLENYFRCCLSVVILRVDSCM